MMDQTLMLALDQPRISLGHSNAKQELIELAASPMYLPQYWPAARRFDGNVICAEERAGNVVSPRARIALEFGPPPSFDEAHDSLVHRFGGHVASQPSGRRMLPGMVVAEIPPGERLNRRMSENRGVKLSGIISLLILCGAIAWTPVLTGAKAGPAHQRGLSEVDRTLQVRVSLAKVPDLLQGP